MEPLQKKSEFMVDVHKGLSKTHKSIPSKYFYDQHGSELFNQISHHPDYYLTNIEIEILNLHKRRLSHLLSNEAFNLIEFGPGEGIKTNLLIDQFLEDSLEFTYASIDISDNYLIKLIEKIKNKYHHLKLYHFNDDYLSGLQSATQKLTGRNVVLFLGSSIGNFAYNEANNFILNLRKILKPGDYVLIGFDLCKDIDKLLRAYNDSDGITKNFNLNLLKRINDELGGDFKINQFTHYGTYNPSTCAMESYLISKNKQIVHIDKLEQKFTFHEFEPIHVESSHKYLLSHIEQLAISNGFQIVEDYMDPEGYFTDSLWQIPLESG